MKTVDSEMSRKVTSLSEKNTKLAHKGEKSTKEIFELKKLLELAVKSDARKDNLIEEQKAAW